MRKVLGLKLVRRDKNDRETILVDVRLIYAAYLHRLAMRSLENSRMASLNYFISPKTTEKYKKQQALTEQEREENIHAATVNEKQAEDLQSGDRSDNTD